MLDYLRSNGHIKTAGANRRRVVVYSDLMEHQLWCRILCEPNTVRARLATHHFVSSAGKLPAECAIATPNIDDAPHAQFCAKRDDLRPQVCLGVRRLSRSVVKLR